MVLNQSGGKDLWGSVVEQATPKARGSSAGNGPLETVEEDNGLRQLELLNRTLLAATDQIRTDLKERIESGIQKPTKAK